MILIIDSKTNKATVYKVKTDACKFLKISVGTLRKYSTEPIAEIKEHLVCFNVEIFQNNSKKRNNYSKTGFKAK